MQISVIFLVIAAVTETTCYKFLALENFNTLLLVDSESLNKNASQVIYSTVNKNENYKIFSFDCHYKEKLIFYIGGTGRVADSLIRLSFGSGQTNEKTLVQNPHMELVAVDWVHDEVYWTSSPPHGPELHKVNLDGSDEGLVLSPANFAFRSGILGLWRFVHVLLDPYESTLFVTVARTDGINVRHTLFKADYQGLHLTELFKDPLESVTYLALDRDGKRIFVNSMTGSEPYFYVINYDGSEIHEFKMAYPLKVIYPFMFFAGKLMLGSHLTDGTLYFYEGKETSPGSIWIDTTGPWSSKNDIVLHIRMYEEDAQLTKHQFYLSQCKTKPCSHRCTVLPVGGATCVCPPDQLLGSDRLTCRGRSTIIIFANSTYITKYDLSANEVSYIKVMETSIFDSHYFREDVIYHSPSEETIYCQSTKRISSRFSSTPTEIMRNVSAVAGLAVDTIHDVVYWIHSPSGLLYESDMNGLSYRRHPRPVLADLQPDRHNLTNHIVLDPYREYLFVISDSNTVNSSLSRFQLTDFEEPKVSIISGEITSIAIQVLIETLYIAKQMDDTDTGTTEVVVETCNYEFEQVATYTFTSSMSTIVGLSVMWNKLFFVVQTPSNEFMLYHTLLPPTGQAIVADKVDDANDVSIFKLSSPFLQISFADYMCYKRNCSHICLDNITCACPENYHLSADNINCVGIGDHDSSTQSHGVSYQNPEDKPQRTRDSFGMNVIIILIVAALLGMVGYTIYKFKNHHAGSFEPSSNEALELH